MQQMEGNRKDKLDLIRLKQYLNKTKTVTILSDSSEEDGSFRKQKEEPESTVKDICKSIGIKVTKQQENQVFEFLIARDIQSKKLN